VEYAPEYKPFLLTVNPPFVTVVQMEEQDRKTGGDIDFISDAGLQLLSSLDFFSLLRV
jgi:hypothetical protein